MSVESFYDPNNYSTEDILRDFYERTYGNLEHTDPIYISSRLEISQAERDYYGSAIEPIDKVITYLLPEQDKRKAYKTYLNHLMFDKWYKEWGRYIGSYDELYAGEAAERMGSVDLNMQTYRQQADQAARSLSGSMFGPGGKLGSGLQSKQNSMAQSVSDSIRLLQNAWNRQVARQIGNIPDAFNISRSKREENLGEMGYIEWADMYWEDPEG